jgi:hypothetical protein
VEIKDQSWPIILATWESEIGRIVVGGQPRQIVQDPTSKITRMTRGVALVTECLLWKCEVLSSNFKCQSYQEKKKKKQRSKTETCWT